ncbi:carbohydrate ABC transporter permease [Actinopolymorpha pittospori]|uniref:Raffinose/stachyose/melibiose transport system permease protein n=1 Tax=Actinopolymorpha pittospori TaxID=648752 RepID=A0A927NCP7_9ACTN|nr:carbohydrate ABC transporter permease [Actinopolymorpha pittospori]MBE1613107.1 raffinose/stachyose/melibiose transport system permease protein [Actinopolymorpha pittospori]
MTSIALTDRRPGVPASRQATRGRGMRALAHVALLVAGIAWMYPFLWTLGSSLKDNGEFFNRGLNPLPENFVWSNYAQAWQQASFGRYFLNTLLITAGTTVATLAVTAMAGYVLARTTFPGKKVCLVLISTTLFLPHGYTIIPTFDLVDRLGLLNSLWSIILVQAAGGIVFGTFLFMGYFMTIAPELEDAARIDGANFHQIFWRVMLPLSGPMIATVGLFTAISAWNSFFIPLVFTLARPDLRTLAVGMYSFIGENSTQWTLLCAGSVITLVPIIVLFLLLQRFFVNGLAGAVKQ